MFSCQNASIASCSCVLCFRAFHSVVFSHFCGHFFQSIFTHIYPFFGQFQNIFNYSNATLPEMGQSTTLCVLDSVLHLAIEWWCTLLPWPRGIADPSVICWLSGKIESTLSICILITLSPWVKLCIFESVSQKLQSFLHKT